jgi:hypothetical protein
VAAPSTEASNAHGHVQPYDLELVFLREHPRSHLALAPDMLFRAQLFLPGRLGTGTLWLLLALVVGGVPYALWRALGATEEPGPHAR